MRSRKRNPISLGAGGVGVAILAAGAGFLLWSNRAKLKTLFTETLNPASTNNAIYQGANSVLTAITGNKVDSVGTATANVFKSDAEKKVDAMLKANGSVPYVGPDLSKGSYYDLGQKAPVLSTSDGTFTGWISSLFKSDAEKQVDDSLRGIGLAGAGRLRTFKTRRK